MPDPFIAGFSLFVSSWRWPPPQAPSRLPRPLRYGPGRRPHPLHQAELYGLGRPRTFEGAALTEIAFPLGGIGTGTISLGGRGNLRDWEIFNRPGKGVDLPFTFFALYCRAGRGEARRPGPGRAACSRLSPARTACTGPKCPACRAWRRPASSASIPSPRSRWRTASCRSRSPSRPSTRSCPSTSTNRASRRRSFATGSRT